MNNSDFSTRVATRKAIRRVLVSYVNMAVTFLAGFLLLTAIALLLGRQEGVVLEADGLLMLLATIVFLYVISPLFVYLYRPKWVTPQSYPDLHELWIGLPTTLLKPRFAVVEMGGVPNAFATGYWPVSVVAISSELHRWYTSGRMSKEQLQAILNHELAHHKLLHTPLLTSFSALAWLADKGLGLWRTAKGNIGYYVIGGISWVVGKIFKVLLAAFSQECEYAADALGAMLSGSPEPLEYALLKLSEESRSDETSPLDAIMTSHPGMSDRQRSLQDLAIPSEESAQS